MHRLFLLLTLIAAFAVPTRAGGPDGWTAAWAAAQMVPVNDQVVPAEWMEDATLRQYLELGGIAGDHTAPQAHVDVALPLGRLDLRCQTRHRRGRRDAVERHVHDRRHAAGRRRTRRAREALPVRPPRLVAVDVRVDESRQHDPIADVQHVVRRRVVRAHVTLLLANIDQLTIQIRALDRDLGRTITHDAVSQRLQTIPGVGALGALILQAEIGPLARFRDAAHLAAYAGCQSTSETPRISTSQIPHPRCHSAVFAVGAGGMTDARSPASSKVPAADGGSAARGHAE